MPTYTFRCRKCGDCIQVTHPFNAPHPHYCQGCDGELERIFDTPNVIYRSSGFYTKDKRLTPVKPEDFNPDED